VVANLARADRLSLDRFEERQPMSASLPHESLHSTRIARRDLFALTAGIALALSACTSPGRSRDRYLALESQHFT
jgi:hypothetical protein